MRDATGKKKISPGTGVPGLNLYPGLSGPAGMFSGTVCKPLWLSLWCAICKYLCQQVSVCLAILGVAVCVYSFMNWVVCVPDQIFAFHYSLFTIHMLLLVICCLLFSSSKSYTLYPQKLKTILGGRYYTPYQTAANKGNLLKGAQKWLWNDKCS